MDSVYRQQSLFSVAHQRAKKKAPASIEKAGAALHQSYSWGGTSAGCLALTVTVTGAVK
jgi:hypothetical protein